MTQLTETDITDIRLHLLDFLKSLFISEPDSTRAALWQEVVAALGRERVSPAMDTAVRTLDELLTVMELDDIRTEFYELFVDPFGEHRAQTTLSFYLDGHDFAGSLIRLRSFLLEAGIVPLTELEECEDSLVYLLDIFAALIREEGSDPERAKNEQEVLLTDFLAPLAVRFQAAMNRNKSARFYEASAAFLTSYVDLEQGLLA